MSKRKIEADDLLKLKSVGDPQISPDGRLIVFTVKTIDGDKNKYLTHLWLAHLEIDEIRQFTFGDVSDTNPRWSPDGKRIAFSRVKEKRQQLWMIQSNGGEASQLTKLDEGSIGAPNWSPDGKKLLFTFRPVHADWTQEAAKKRTDSNRSAPARVITKTHYRLDGFGFIDTVQHLWFCDSTTGETKQLMKGEYEELDPAWSSDGSEIAFISNRSDDPDDRPYVDQDIWVMSAEGGKLRKLNCPIGTKSALLWTGKQIAYLANDNEEDAWAPKHTRLWQVDSDGKISARCLTSKLDRTLGATTLSDTTEAFAGGAKPIVSTDGKNFHVIVSDEGKAHLYRVDSAQNTITPMTKGAMNIVGATADASVKMFALAVVQPTQLTEIYLGTQVNGAVRLKQLTHLNEDWHHQLKLSEPEEVWFKSDKQKIQGWLLRPTDFNPKKKYPFLLYVHGGPHAQYGYAFFHELQWHAARGYVVFYTNPRGSTGRDENFLSCIRGDWGKLDYNDVMAAADYAETLSYVDGKRMAIAGGSYGGYMTNWVIGHTNRFKCAITDRSISNLHSDFGTCDFPGTIDGYWAGDSWENWKIRWDQSPLKFVKNIKTPLLMIHSEGDLRCPIEQAEQFYVALKRLKREVVFVRYPKETSHGLSRTGPPDLRLDRLERYAEWLDRYLK